MVTSIYGYLLHFIRKEINVLVLISTRDMHVVYLLYSHVYDHVNAIGFFVSAFLFSFQHCLKFYS